jgi:BMFP domain-containing protein YqiC
VEDVLRRLDVVRREEMDAALEMAARARAGQEAAESRLAALEARLDALEAAAKPLGGGEPGMIA